MGDQERVVITYEEAIKMIADGDSVHTFRSNGIALIGCSWDRETLLHAMRDSKEIELSGDIAQSMNHGIAIFDALGPLFIETKKGE